MKLLNIRQKFTLNSTQGSLYVDGVWICYVLEPSDDGLDSSMTLQQINAIKQPRLSKTPKQYTAIPTGIYPVELVTCPDEIKHFPSLVKEGLTQLPELKNITGYDGVLIHLGNYEAPGHDDSLACQMLGMTLGVDFIGSSGGAFDVFRAKCWAALAAGGVTYEIQREPITWNIFTGKSNN